MTVDQWRARLTESPVTVLYTLAEPVTMPITGDELAEKLSGYLEVLFEAEPTAVGGKLPGDDFYYNAAN